MLALTRGFMASLSRLVFAIITSSSVIAWAGTAQGSGSGGPIPAGLLATSGVVTSNIVLSNSGYVAPGNAITVTLLGLQHDFAGDLQITLSYINSSSATLQSVDLVNRIGVTSTNLYGTAADFGNNLGNGDNYVFNSDYAGNIWTAANCADPPTCSEPLGDADSIPGVSTDTVNFGQYFTSTAGGTKTNLSYAFAGMSVSGGTWRLTITDAQQPNTGSFIGWQISIATVATNPTTLAVYSGTPQTTTVTTSFTSALQAHVTDSNANPVSGVPVSFSAPSSGASATFAGSSSITAVTNTSGIAVSPIPAANATAGSYSVAAAVAGVTSSVSFSLTNSAKSNSPLVTLSAASLNFGSQAQGTTSGSQTLGITNSGTASLVVSSVQVSGTNATDFKAANKCGGSVAAGGSCAVILSFDPTATGARGATVSITDNAPGSPQTVALSGTGTASPSTFTGYLAPYGGSYQTFNGPSVVLPLRLYTPLGATQVNYLAANLNSISSGGTTEYWIYAETDGAGGYTLRLTNGSVTQPSPYLEMTPSGLTVGLNTPIAVGTLEIVAYRFALVGDEFQLDVSLTRSGSFDDEIVVGGQEGTSTYASPGNVTSGQWTSAAASGPSVTLSPTSLTFGTRSVGTSATQSLSVTNSGTVGLSVTGVQITGTNASDYSAMNGCTASVDPGGSCTISVSFDPDAAGARSATLSITDNASNSPQTVALSGTGSTAATPTTFTAYLAPYGGAFQTFTGSSAVLPLRLYDPAGLSQITYMVMNLNSTSTDSTKYVVVVQSDGSGGYTMRVSTGNYSATEPAWPFLELNPSGSTVSLSTPITLNALQITAYRFALVGNEMQLDLSVNRSDTFNDEIVIQGIQGTSTYTSPWVASDGAWVGSGSTTPAVTLSSTSLNFGTQTVGVSATQTVTVSNTGGAALSVTGAQVRGTNAGDFTLTNGCTTSVSPGSSCTIGVNFDPSAAGARSATLSITDNASNSPQTVALSGTGSTAVTPTTFTAYLAPYGGAFQTFTGSSAVLPLRLYDPAGLSQITYMVMNLNSTSTGSTEYVMVVQSDGSGGYTMRVSTGNYSATQPAWPFLELNPSGSTVSLSTPITLNTVQITAYRFALVGNEMQLDLSVNRSDTFNDQIVIQGIQGTSTYTVPWVASDGAWVGSGSTTPAVTLSSTSLNFGTQTVGVSATQTVTVSNTGGAALSVTGAQVTGTNAGDFTLTNGCTTSVSPGNSCTISVNFDPGAAGARSATLSISDNASNSPQTVSLTGTGSNVATPTTFTTYLAPYGGAFQTFTGSSAVLPLRLYDPAGLSQITYFVTYLNSTSSGSTEYIIIVQSDGSGGYYLRATTGDYSETQPAWPFLELNPSGSTITPSTPITLNTLQITAYRFALAGNEMQLDISANRTDTFNDQIAIDGIQGSATYTYPWGASDGAWHNP